MRAERVPVAAQAGVVAIHATAVALDGAALLICGRSGAGKSTLAAALIRDAGAGADLIGDDRVLLVRGDGVFTARAHPRTAGFIERRGLGIVAAHHVDAAPVGGVVRLDGSDGSAEADALLRYVPALSLAEVGDAQRRCACVRDWWAGRSAAFGPQIVRKAALTAFAAAKDYNCSNAST